MKIKTKKQLNLPQLIEWAWKNDVKGENFPTDQNEEAGIYFATNSDFMMNNADYIRYNNTFTVEVDEEITEDTFFKHLIKVTEDGEHYSTDFFKVRDLIQLGTEEIHAYIDGEYKLIWTHEKGLVE